MQRIKARIRLFVWEAGGGGGRGGRGRKLPKAGLGWGGRAPTSWEAGAHGMGFGVHSSLSSERPVGEMGPRRRALLSGCDLYSQQPGSVWALWCACGVFGSAGPSQGSRRARRKVSVCPVTAGMPRAPDAEGDAGLSGSGLGNSAT